MFTDGDAVVCRFTFRGTQAGPFFGLPATRRQVALAAIAIDRWTHGRLIERWVAINFHDLLHAFGGAPIRREQSSETN